MILRTRQQGMSFIALIIVIGFIAYNAYVGIKLVPEYLEFQSVKSSVDSLAEEMETRPMSKAQAMELLNLRLSTSYIEINRLRPSSKYVEETKTKRPEVFHFKRERNNTEMGLRYEKRLPLFANVEVLLDFQYVKKIPIKN